MLLYDSYKRQNLPHPKIIKKVFYFIFICLVIHEITRAQYAIMYVIKVGQVYFYPFKSRIPQLLSFAIYPFVWSLPLLSSANEKIVGFTNARAE